MKASSFKHTVWDSCAIYVKLREADLNGNCKCCTCGKTGYWKEFDAGHFVPGRGNAVLFDDAHIFPQCPGCNCKGGGEQYKFGEFLKKRYGYSNEILEEILNMRHTVKKYNLFELKLIRNRFNDEIARLRKEKGIYD